MSQPMGTALAAGATAHNQAVDLDVPSTLRRQVTIAFPDSWVRKREGAVATLADETTTILMRDVQCHVASNARFERVIRRVRQQAGGGAHEWNLDFDPSNEHVTLHSIVVRRVGENQECALPANLRIDPGAPGGRSGSSTCATILVALKDVREGDVIDASYTVRSTPRLLQGRYWFMQRVPCGTGRFTFCVRFQRTRSMRWRSGPVPLAPMEKLDDTETEWSWSVPENREGAEAWIQVSDIPTWREVTEALLKAWRTPSDEAELIACADEIIAREITPARRLSRAVEFVRTEILLRDAEGRVRQHAPAPSSAVLRARAGDERDRATLLFHLLHRVGIPTHLILTGGTRTLSLSEVLPAPDVFDRVLVEAAGRCYRLDGTATNNHTEGELGLVLAADSAELEPLPPFHESPASCASPTSPPLQKELPLAPVEESPREEAPEMEADALEKTAAQPAITKPEPAEAVMEEESTPIPVKRRAPVLAAGRPAHRPAPIASRPFRERLKENDWDSERARRKLRERRIQQVKIALGLIGALGVIALWIAVYMDKAH